MSFAVSCALAEKMPAKKNKYNNRALMLSFYGLQPGLRHQPGAGQGGVYAIHGPVGAGGGLLGLVVNFLIGDERGAEAIRDLAGRLAIFIEIRIPLIVDGFDADDGIRFADDELHIRKRLFGSVEQCLVVVAIGLDRACVSVDERMPEIVNAYKDAEHGGFEIETIRLPAIGELIHLIAAHAFVVAFERLRWVTVKHLRSGHEGIARTHAERAVGRLIALFAAGIRDAVALKEDDVLVREGNLFCLFGSVSCGYDLRDIDGCQAGQRRGL